MSGEPEEVAIVGLAGRFPGAPDAEAFWRNLRDGVDAIARLSDEELLAAGEKPEALANPAYVKACPALDGADTFDAEFFNVSEHDAALMDPQHRVFLEVAWAALEDAGYDASRAGAVGVFAACGMSAYMMYHLVTNRSVMETVGEWLVRHTANDMNFLATRVSYELNLTGPSMNVQTACSSSLVAIHLAAQSLLSNECDMALAGASVVLLPLRRGYLYKDGEILSPDGRCRPFDARSAGTVFGSGAGVVVLKRLSDALRDGDEIRAVLKGSAVNNDGAGKVGYLAPSVDGQAAAVSEALAVSGVAPDSISYVEAHGTGTLVGDPIEVTALTQAWREETERNGFCAIGSVKSNFGHLGEAAGMASVIKTVLAMKHREIPPSLHFETPNPRIDFASSPFFVNAALRPWSGPSPLRAGVTALGAGGTNAHLVLEEPPPAPRSAARRAPQVLCLSARNREALDAASSNLAAHLESHPERPLADAAYTLQVGRKAFRHRRAVVASSREEAVERLRAAPVADDVAEENPSIVFMLPGGGAQHGGMARELAEKEPVFRAEIERSLEAVAAPLRARVRRVLLEGPGEDDERPSIALPSLFAFEWALARTLQAWGLAPAALIGHSMGEYVAAALADVVSLEDGLALVAERGRLFETLPPGGMLAVPLGADELAPLLSAELSIAADNAPGLSVASGPLPALDALERTLAARGVEATRVHISVAAHSAMLDGILAPFESFCRGLSFRAPRIPIVSNLTGALLGDDEARDPGYWPRHLRGTVRFASGLETLLASPRILVEVGPGRTLTSLARAHGGKAKTRAIPTARHPKEPGSDHEVLLGALARLWAAGANVDWKAFHDGEPLRRVSLPTYPFQRKRYWIEARDPLAGAADEPTLDKKRELADWFLAPAWKKTPLPRSLGSHASERWLVFLDEAGLASRLVQRLRVADGAPREIHTVSPGERYHESGGDARARHFTIDPHAPGDYRKLAAALGLPALRVDRIVHAWNVTAPGRVPGNWGAWEPWAWRGLLFLAQALGDAPPFALTVLSNQLQRVGADEDLVPEKAALLGPVRVIPREVAGATARSVDVVLAAPGSWQDARLLDQLAAELRGGTEPVVAWRGPDRLVEILEPLPLDASGPAPVRDGGVYLVTGAFGGLGGLVARRLASRARVRLVLVGRRERPESAAFVRELEAAGAEVLTVSADVASRAEMQAAFSRAKARFGRIDGVVHAAGVLDDALLALKTPESAARVLAPKVTGTLLLDELTRRERLDFFVLFSSVSARLGPPGQIDYAAANAFLDAFAEWKTARDGTPAIAIAWGPWTGVGMASRLGASREAPPAPAPHPEPARVGGHPFLPPPLSDGPDEARFAIPLARGSAWLIDDHVISGGEAVLPGTAYLELARAAWGRANDIELSDVAFETPFAVPEGSPRTLFLRIDRRRGAFAFTSAAGVGEVTHATGRVASIAPQARREDLAALLARCPAPGRVKDGFLDQSLLAFGPRWRNVERVATGSREAVALLALPPELASDCGPIALHPALLDMATGGAQHLIEGFDASRDFFVPLSYTRLALHRPLPPRLAAHVVLREGARGGGVAVFDVTLMDRDGSVVAEVNGFTMRRLESRDAFAPARPVAAEGRASKLFQTVLRAGIAPEEGMDAFERILASRPGARVVASPVDLRAWDAALSRPEAEEPDPAPRARDASRPLVAPRTELEEKIAGVFRAILGTEEIGIHDSFFELGGHSLLLIRAVTRIRPLAEVELPLAAAFATPTVAGIAAAVETARADGAAAPAASNVVVPLARAAYRVRRSDLDPGAVRH